MLISLLIFSLIANAVIINGNRLILFFKIITNSLLLATLLAYINLYITPLVKGISVYELYLEVLILIAPIINIIIIYFVLYYDKIISTIISLLRFILFTSIPFNIILFTFISLISPFILTGLLFSQLIGFTDYIFICMILVKLVYLNIYYNIGLSIIVYMLLSDLYNSHKLLFFIIIGISIILLLYVFYGMLCMNDNSNNTNNASSSNSAASKFSYSDPNKWSFSKVNTSKINIILYKGYTEGEFIMVDSYNPDGTSENNLDKIVAQPTSKCDYYYTDKSRSIFGINRVCEKGEITLAVNRRRLHEFGQENIYIESEPVAIYDYCTKVPKIVIDVNH